MTAADDRKTLERVVAGDKSALGKLHDAYCPVMFPIVLRVLRTRSDAEDCLQDIWMEVWRRADRYDPSRGPVIAWLMTLARSRALDRYRSRSSRNKAEEKTPPPEPSRTQDPSLAPELSQTQSRVRTAMKSLDDHHRKVLELAYWNGLSQSQIAKEVDAPLGTVKSWMRQGLVKLQAQLPREDWS